MAYLERLNLGALLTARQEQVANLVGFGLSRKEAADKLGISYKTVDNEVQQIYARIGATKMTELTIFLFLQEIQDSSIFPTVGAFSSAYARTAWHGVPSMS